MPVPTGTGGWRPSLVTTPGPLAAEASFLASEHGMVKRVGVTLDATTVGVDANGDKVLKAGTVLGKITASGKYRAYDNALGATAGGTAEGFLEESVNLRNGDVVAGILIHGSVLSARTSGLDASAQTDLAGRVIFQ
jgi:hypothetical protein